MTQVKQQYKCDLVTSTAVSSLSEIDSNLVIYTLRDLFCKTNLAEKCFSNLSVGRSQLRLHIRGTRKFYTRVVEVYGSVAVKTRFVAFIKMSNVIDIKAFIRTATLIGDCCDIEHA